MGAEFRETGHATDDDRRSATWDLWERITSGEDWRDNVSAWEANFIDSIEGSLDVGWDISAKEYFKLKDIYDQLVDRGRI